MYNMTSILRENWQIFDKSSQHIIYAGYKFTYHERFPDLELMAWLRRKWLNDTAIYSPWLFTENKKYVLYSELQSSSSLSTYKIYREIAT